MESERNSSRKWELEIGQKTWGENLQKGKSIRTNESRMRIRNNFHALSRSSAFLTTFFSGFCGLFICVESLCRFSLSLLIKNIHVTISAFLPLFSLKKGKKRDSYSQKEFFLQAYPYMSELFARVDRSWRLIVHSKRTRVNFAIYTCNGFSPEEDQSFRGKGIKRIPFCLFVATLHI